MLLLLALNPPFVCRWIYYSWESVPAEYYSPLITERKRKYEDYHLFSDTNETELLISKSVKSWALPSRACHQRWRVCRSTKLRKPCRSSKDSSKTWMSLQVWYPGNSVKIERLQTSCPTSFMSFSSLTCPLNFLWDWKLPQLKIIDVLTVLCTLSTITSKHTWRARLRTRPAWQHLQSKWMPLSRCAFRHNELVTFNKPSSPLSMTPFYSHSSLATRWSLTSMDFKLVGCLTELEVWERIFL